MLIPFIVVVSLWSLSFIGLLFFGTMVVLSSCYWVVGWIGLEMNLMAIIPIILHRELSLVGSGGLKYFLIQVISSVSVLFVSLGSVQYYWLEWLLPFPLLLKLGLFPFWMWVPHVFATSTILVIFILSTWQNLAPLFLLSSCYWVVGWIGLVCFYFSTFIGGVGALKSFDLKVIVAYSSVVHSSWIALVCIISIYLWVVYVLLYSVVLALVMITIIHISSGVVLLWLGELNTYHNFMMTISLMSLSGLPPFIGFVIKMFIFSTLIVWCPWNVAAMTIILPLSTFYYFQLFLTNITLSNSLMVSESYLIPSMLIVFAISCIVLF